MVTRTRLQRLSTWARCPGNDFRSLWAAWLLERDWRTAAWERLIEKPLTWFCCALSGGHTVTDDQCGKPEHRYCAACGRPTPLASVK